MRVYEDESDVDLSEIGDKEIFAVEEENDLANVYVTDLVQEGNMNPITSNAVARFTGANYSTSEVKTSNTWIDGKPIYRRVFTGLSYGDGSADWQATGITISDVSQITSFVGIRDVCKGLFYPTTIRMNGTSVEIYCTENISPRATGAIVEYTKTTD